MMDYKMIPNTDRKPLRWIHIGDLHITDASQQNHADFTRIIDDVNRHAGQGIDFVYLPGDIADDGSVEQFCDVVDKLETLKALWRSVPGEHDFKPGSLDNYYSVLGCTWLPHAEEINGCICLFLDVVSAGTGGPDFRLGRQQIDWLKRRLGAARREAKTAVVFMHVYPADLGEESAEVAALIDDSPVVLVDMGHTHYNELSNDGRTIYAATRSTGQIEEGEVGFAFVAVDRDAVSWRFKPLNSSWPFVMITSPPDRRLMLRDAARQPSTLMDVRATVWGAAPIAKAEVRIDEGEWHPLAQEASGLLRAELPAPRQAFRLSVRVADHSGAADTDVIDVDFDAGHARRSYGGSDAGSIGAWHGRHLHGTQLGPNRNGKKW